MTCDFCGCELPVFIASNDTDTLMRAMHNAETEADGNLVLSLSDKEVYQFWSTHIAYNVEGFRHLCKECASKLDVFGNKLLERDCHRRILNYRNIAANVLNTIRGKELHPYMVAVDVGVKDHPVAQVCRKDGERWVVTNTVMDDDVGHFMTYLEGSANA